jgi:hypothetical protein
MESTLMTELIDPEHLESFLDLPHTADFEKAVLYMWLFVTLGFIAYLSPALALVGFLYVISVDWTIAKTLQPAFSTLDDDEDSLAGEGELKNSPHRAKKTHEDLLDAVHTPRISLDEIRRAKKI